MFGKYIFFFVNIFFCCSCQGFFNTDTPILEAGVIFSNRDLPMEDYSYDVQTCLNLFRINNYDTN